jgi:hypothetical protein
MNREEIIAKTFDDMRRYDTTFESNELRNADRDAE